MKYSFTMLVFVCVVTASGCAHLKKSVSAEPLDENLVTVANLENSRNDSRRYLGEVVWDSMKKCNDFMAQLVVAENTSNTALDMSTTVFSALATAFTPLATVHAMSAGATIASGWRTDIDTNIYAKAGIATYAQAISVTYYKDMKGYLQTLENERDAEIVAALEVPKIQSIHQECSLAAAQMTVNATMQVAASTDTGGGTAAKSVDSVVVVGPFLIHENILAIATSIDLPDSPVVTAYTVTDKVSLADVALGLADALKNNPKLQSARVYAEVHSDGKTVSIALTSPTVASIRWQLQPEGKFKLASHASGDVLPARTQGVVPGRALY
ncbi:hypothetical protein [Paraburkholderia sp. BCC1876]|jgi:hypothetical protein|uniref:hypothetical protein n=1 Tax=Paraburkholderia sp. BCC1876 TaxID=2676303 RepID=UPI001591F6EC|nr:hypothetical protein [Paraburkholderia sp. BCC1876]